MDGVKNCLRHRRYDEEDQAKEVLGVLKKQARNRSLTVYECKEGGTKHWHIGNPHNRRSQRRRRGKRLSGGR